jgi:predicted nucleic acid-binding protein
VIENLLMENISQNRIVIICDTNVFLRIYDYSPEFTDFALKCLKSIKPNLVITYTTNLEYLNHYRGKYSSAKRKIKDYSTKLNEIVSRSRLEVTKEFERIQTYKFPDIDKLRVAAEIKIDELTDLFSNYYDEHSLLVEVNDEYLKMDPVEDFFKSLSDKVMQEFRTHELYAICDEGFTRYKEKYPPGFKDKDKDGIRKYSDLILWKEIIRYSKENKIDVVFVTDDVKLDWWEEVTSDTGTIKKTFHQKLLSEFNKETKQEIFALTSNELFNMISTKYNIEKSDAIDIALKQTLENFVLKNQDRVFERIQDTLSSSQEEYIKNTNDIGSEGLSDFEIDDYKLISAEQIEREDEEIVYHFNYSVSLIATSTDYWGKDYETKEIILSPENEHFFKGEIIVKVIRFVDQFIDFSLDNDFEDAEIIEGSFSQTKFVNQLNQENDYTSVKNYCPRCGLPIDFESDSVNGFCVECTSTYEI